MKNKIIGRYVDFIGMIALFLVIIFWFLGCGGSGNSGVQGKKGQEVQGSSLEGKDALAGYEAASGEETGKEKENDVVSETGSEENGIEDGMNADAISGNDADAASETDAGDDDGKKDVSGDAKEDSSKKDPPECEKNIDCDDWNVCTEDICKEGKCVKGKIISCDDGNDCTDDSCDPLKGCVYVYNKASCDDGNACTKEDLCEAGECKSGIFASCDDGNPCTDDLCDSAKGCVHKPNSQLCFDGDPVCTIGDICKEGACVSGENVCKPEDKEFGDPCAEYDDNNLCNGTYILQGDYCVLDPESVVICIQPESSCRESVCDPATGKCSEKNLADGAICNDGNPCTSLSVCKNGFCIMKSVTNCDDGNPCTEDKCDQETGCVNTPLEGEKCEDGNPCTAGEFCSAAGFCIATENKCKCFEGADCAAYDDGNACNGKLMCKYGICVLDEASIVTCEPLKDSPCMKNVCEETSGKCVAAPVADGIPCSDLDPCTTGDVCSQGKCEGEIVPDESCDDKNECTKDYCKKFVGCRHDPEIKECDDGKAWTEGDMCVNGVCKGTTVCVCSTDYDCKKFEDGNLCNGSLRCSNKCSCEVDPKTVISCDTSSDTDCRQTACEPSSGICVPEDAFDGTKCDDKSGCTINDSCKGGVCVGTPIDCSDTSPCTDDSCDPSSGCKHAFNWAPCNDNNACTSGDMCNGAGICTGTKITIVGAGQCMQVTCDPKTGEIFQKMLDNVACDCKNPCTEGDMCKKGTCVCGPLKKVDDGNVCTDDYCTPEEGIKHIPNNAKCDDKNACTTGEKCSGGICGSGVPISCDDGNVCTDDLCDTAKGCLYVFNKASCDDKNVCTEGDFCEQGKCMSGSKYKNCGDNNICTDDSCDPVNGCVYTYNTAPCDDKNACTAKDICSGGLCEGTKISCDDGNICTDDLCDSKIGCVHKYNTVSCDDGNFCTENDKCQAGVCKGKTVNCDDGNACTEDICMPAKGCIYSEVKCNDGKICTDDFCDPKTGCYFAANYCDGNPCTKDECDEVNGPKHINLDGTSCDDMDPCTVNMCVEGTCKVLGETMCPDDGNPCTVETCEMNVGCVVKNVEGECDDSDLCTTGDTCIEGNCAGTYKVDCDDGNPCTKDACTPGGGCEHIPQQAGICEDGDACTSGDICVEGKCMSGEKMNCDDKDMCTEDFCDSEKGCAHVDSSKDCMVDSPCQKGICNSQLGCVIQFIEGACDDGDPCTENDFCASGYCMPGVSKKSCP